MDELSYIIADADRFKEIAEELALLRKELGSVKLRDALVYPLMFRRVRGSYADRRIEDLPGVRLTKGHHDRLESLMGELAEHCGTYRMPMTLEVLGYSSEVPFLNEAAAESNQLNLSAANLRARNVAMKLKSLVEEIGLECEVSVRRCVWPAYDSFGRPDFLDSHEFRWQLREAVARTVFVRVADDGQCYALTGQ
ncbi:MAG: hypothetical protein OXG82_15075 [Gammaproteobacteria bacterium]|nr:hypothetical protein [Gammaproteobacteria bacterium]